MVSEKIQRELCFLDGLKQHALLHRQRVLEHWDDQWGDCEDNKCYGLGMEVNFRAYQAALMVWKSIVREAHKTTKRALARRIVSHWIAFRVCEEHWMQSKRIRRR